MNSDLDNNTDPLDSRLIAWLLQESGPAASSPTDEQAHRPIPNGEPTAADFELEQLELDLDELTIASDNTTQADEGRTRAGSEHSGTRTETEPGGETRPYYLGEMPTVQNRFEAILKRRLQVEIERHPPLFPWETEISDYESDPSDAVADSWVPPIGVWMPQLSHLALPVAMPETVLAQLLDACSEVVYSRYQLGAKLVNAVKNLFPGQFQSLNQLAGLVLLQPSRSPAPPQYLPGSYESAAAEQKMTLALLAAKEIISALTVPIASEQTPVERQWQTAAGVVTVQVDYQLQAGVPKLRAIAQLPLGGSMTLRSPHASVTSERLESGYLSVEALDVPPNQTYPLEIRFHDSEQTPLIFALCPTM